MRYQEILDEIVNAIKGGANWNGESKSEGVTNWLETYSQWVADIINTVVDFFKSLGSLFSEGE